MVNASGLKAIPLASNRMRVLLAIGNRLSWTVGVHNKPVLSNYFMAIGRFTLGLNTVCN
jgi:hypothetical protein